MPPHSKEAMQPQCGHYGLKSAMWQRALKEMITFHETSVKVGASGCGVETLSAETVIRSLDPALARNKFTLKK